MAKRPNRENVAGKQNKKPPEWWSAHLTALCKTHKISMPKNLTGTFRIKRGVGINFDDAQIIIPKDINRDSNHGNDLNKEETWSSLMLLLHLIDKGYAPKHITLEKTYPLGRKGAGRVDFYVADPKSKNSFMIDAKTNGEFEEGTKPGNNKKAMRQIISYGWQDNVVTRVSLYTYNFNESRHHFAHLSMDNMRKSSNVAEAVSCWDGSYDHSDFIEEKELFSAPELQIIKFNQLEKLTRKNIDGLKVNFMEILRLNAISDKPGAFMVFVNLLLCKIYCERHGDITFKIKDDDGGVTEHTGQSFQYVRGRDTDVSFLTRLQDILKDATLKYLRREIVDYSDDDISDKLNQYNVQDKKLRENIKDGIMDMFTNLRLKRNNPFAFAEVHDDKTFAKNAKIVKEVVSALQSYQFRYDFRQQFLGDFFEELLVTGLKQDEGQFFTPVPLVDFIVSAVPVERTFRHYTQRKMPKYEIPRMIDYACGAGHFLISYMDRVENIMNKIDAAEKTKYQLKGTKNYGWVDNLNVVGIEKDYRLAKTAKVASFFNGDGEMDVVTGDGINKFSSDEYQGSAVHSPDKKELENFDFVLSNPPFSVKGFAVNLKVNGVDKSDFSLLNGNSLKDADSAIEIFFVERAWQLLRPNGMAAILLPQSVLSTDNKYHDLRKFIFEHFKIRAMLLTTDNTFFATTTSPVVLFLEKAQMSDLKYDVMFMYSPKYRNVKTSKKLEEEFLGYKFSNSQNVSSIKVDSNGGDMHKVALPALHAFLSGKKYNLPDDGSCKIKQLEDVVIGKYEHIFPLYEEIKGGHPLSKFFTLVGSEEGAKQQMPDEKTPYFEISDLGNSHKPLSGKKKKGFVCQKDDVLVSCLTPTSGKIAKAKRSYVLTQAIYALRVKPKYKNKLDSLINQLKDENTIASMNSLISGFKRTYAKISSDNLMQYIKIKEKKE